MSNAIKQPNRTKQTNEATQRTLGDARNAIAAGCPAKAVIDGLRIAADVLEGKPHE